MKAELLFSIANSLALICWLVLAVFPRKKLTCIAVLSGGVPVLLSVAYLILILLFLGSAEGGFNSLPDVMKLFTNEWVVLAGWLHYLAFDLLIGSWEVTEAQAKGISHLLVIPCLFLTFMLGPVGFLVFVVLRFFLAKEVRNVSETV